MKIKFLAMALLASVSLVACNEADKKEVETTAPVTETQNNEKANIKELVYNLSNRIVTDKSAVIMQDQLIVQDSAGDTVYDLTNEDFFVSIAPYIEQTHPWTNHSLTGCQGELVEQEFKVYIEDMDGKVIVDETLKSQPNGFIDLWLPRDKKFQVKIEHAGKMVEAELSTFETDGTCITNLQLM